MLGKNIFQGVSLWLEIEASQLGKLRSSNLPQTSQITECMS
jgi:hypothetical protein